MKFCQPHWEALREAIYARGLGHLVAANGRDAAARTAAGLEGKMDLSDYDPLMAAHWMISTRALEQGGLYMLTGEYCPVCEAIHGHASTMTREEVERCYIDGPADACLEFCREHGIDKPFTLH